MKEIKDGNKTLVIDGQSLVIYKDGVQSAKWVLAIYSNEVKPYICNGAQALASGCPKGYDLLRVYRIDAGVGHVAITPANSKSVIDAVISEWSLARAQYTPPAPAPLSHDEQIRLARIDRDGAWIDAQDALRKAMSGDAGEKEIKSTEARYQVACQKLESLKN